MTEIETRLRAVIGHDMLVESMVDGKMLGGEGVITDVFHFGDDLWVAVDYGMSWVVRPEGFNLEPSPSRAVDAGRVVE